MDFRFSIFAICQDTRVTGKAHRARRGGMSSRNPMSGGPTQERPLPFRIGFPSHCAVRRSLAWLRAPPDLQARRGLGR